METLESSRMCRLCGKHSGISINIFDKNENHIRKINAVLPIMVHEMDLLPKHMCHRCSYKLEEFHKFYVDCLRTDADLKSQLSWMRKENAQETTGVPMVQIENVKIKAEPPDYDIYELDPIAENVSYIKSMSSMTFPVNSVRRDDIQEGLAYTAYARCGCYFNKGQNRRTAGKLYAKTTKDSESRNYSGPNEIDAIENNMATGPAQIIGTDQFRHSGVSQNCQDYNAERTNNMIKDTRKCKSSVETKESNTLSNGNDLFDRSKVLSNPSALRISKNTIVRNLRPRKGSIDYVGTKKKTLATRKPDLEIRSQSADGKIRILTARPDCEQIVQIKSEPCDGSERRMLRPRTKVIDYLGRKRKEPQTAAEQRRSKSEEHVAKRMKSNTSDTDSWPPTIKTEIDPVEDDFDFSLQKQLLVSSSIVDASTSDTNGTCETKTETRLGAKNFEENVDILPSNILIKVEDNVSENTIADSARSRCSSHFVGKLKSLGKEKSEKSSKAVGSKRKVSAHFSPKYLRSQDGHLRNGKVKKFDSNSISMKKFRRNLHHITAGNRVVSKNIFKVIKENVCGKSGSGTEKLVEVKHYCEKCNASFVNKELYKLHACYYD